MLRPAVGAPPPPSAQPTMHGSGGPPPPSSSGAGGPGGGGPPGMMGGGPLMMGRAPAAPPSMAPPPTSSSMAGASQQQQQRHAVHVVWDIEAVAVPPSASPSASATSSDLWVMNAIIALAERECQGFVESFAVCCREGFLEHKSKMALQYHGVAVEEVNPRKSTDTFMLTRLMAIALQTAMTRAPPALAMPHHPPPSHIGSGGGLLAMAGGSSAMGAPPPPANRPILVVISGERDLLRALNICRETGLFQEIVLLHPHDTHESMKNAATQAIEWYSFLSIHGFAAAQAPLAPPPMTGGGGGRIAAAYPPPGFGGMPRGRIGAPPPTGTTPESRYRAMSDERDENRPMGGRGEWAAWQDKSGADWREKQAAQRVAQQQGGGGERRKSEVENWRTPAEPPTTPYRTPSQRARLGSISTGGAAQRVHSPTGGAAAPSMSPPSPAEGVSTPPGGSLGVGMPPPAAPWQYEAPSMGGPSQQQAGGLMTPPSSRRMTGDVRVMDVEDRAHRGDQPPQRDRDFARDLDQERHQRAMNAVEVLREKEAWEREQQQQQQGGRMRSGSTASSGGRLIPLDEEGGPASRAPTLMPQRSSAGSVSSSGGSGGGSGGSTPTSSTSAPATPSYASMLKGSLGSAGTPGSGAATITPKSASSSKATTPSSSSAGASGASTPSSAASAASTPRGGSSGGVKGMDRSALAMRLFTHVMNVCAEEKIIPRESVIRSKLEDTAIWDVKKDQCPANLRSWSSLKMEFETWLDLVQAKKACVCVGVSPQRVLWPSPPQPRFECADYFRPQERLNAREMTLLVEFLAHDRPQAHEQATGQVDRGRYGFANYLKSCGPQFVREMPRGYVVELVQLLLNKNFLQFRKGKVSFRATAAGRWKRALEAAQAGGAAPSLDMEEEDEENRAGAVDEEQASAANLAARMAAAAANQSSGSGTSTTSRAKASTTALTPATLRAGSESPDSSCESPPVRRARAATLPLEGKARGGATSPMTMLMGPSLDFDDPVELLASKCVDSHSPAEKIRRAEGGALLHQIFFPLYHFEKSGEQHAPLWVCVVTLDLRYPGGRMPLGTVATGTSFTPPSYSGSKDSPNAPQRPKRFRSTRKAKKLEAQQEAAMRAIESAYWGEAFVPPEGATAPTIKTSSGQQSVKDYVPNLMDDPVVVLDRLLITLEQAPAVYTMDSAITQHGSGSRTMWTCGVQLALRPRPAHLTTGTISVEQAENGEMPSLTEDAPSVRYPTIKWTESQAKKFDAKGKVAAHVLQQLERQKHRYPMLFLATPEPLAKPKAIVALPQVPTAPSPPPAAEKATSQQQQQVHHSSGGSGGGGGVLTPSSSSFRGASSHATTTMMAGGSGPSGGGGASSGFGWRPALSSSAPSSSTSSSLAASGGSSALSQYHQEKAQAHAAAAGQHQPPPLHRAPAMVSSGGGPPAATPGTSGASRSAVSSTLRPNAQEWTGASSGSMSPAASSALPSGAFIAQTGRPVMQPAGAGSAPSSPGEGGLFGRPRMPMIRTFLPNLTAPSSAPSRNRTLVSSASSAGGASSASSEYALASTGGAHGGSFGGSGAGGAHSFSAYGGAASQQTSYLGSAGASLGYHSPISLQPTSSPTASNRAVTPPSSSPVGGASASGGGGLRGFVSPLGRSRPVSESALGLGSGGLQIFDNDPRHGEGGSSSPTMTTGHRSRASPALNMGSSSTGSRTRRLEEDDAMKAMRRSVDSLLDDSQPRPRDSGLAAPPPQGLTIPSPARSHSGSSEATESAPAMQATGGAASATTTASSTSSSTDKASPTSESATATTSSPASTPTSSGASTSGSLPSLVTDDASVVTSSFGYRSRAPTEYDLTEAEEGSSHTMSRRSSTASASASDGYMPTPSSSPRHRSLSASAGSGTMRTGDEHHEGTAHEGTTATTTASPAAMSGGSDVAMVAPNDAVARTDTPASSDKVKDAQVTQWQPLQEPQQQREKEAQHQHQAATAAASTASSSASAEKNVVGSLMQKSDTVKSEGHTMTHKDAPESPFPAATHSHSTGGSSSHPASGAPTLASSATSMSAAGATGDDGNAYEHMGTGKDGCSCV